MRLDSTAGGSSTVPANGIPCHCEERSNEAFPSPKCHCKGRRAEAFPSHQCHCKGRSDEAILTSIKIASLFPFISNETRLSSAYLFIGRDLFGFLGGTT
jgi:hypothetical protein